MAHNKHVAAKSPLCSLLSACTHLVHGLSAPGLELFSSLIGEDEITGMVGDVGTGAGPGTCRFRAWGPGFQLELASQCGSWDAEGMLCRGSQVPDMRAASAPRGEVGLCSLRVFLLMVECRGLMHVSSVVFPPALPLGCRAGWEPCGCWRAGPCRTL